MDMSLLKKSKPKLICGGVPPVGNGLIQVETICSGAVIPDATSSGGNTSSKPLNLADYVDAITFQENSSLTVDNVKNFLQNSYDYFVDGKSVSSSMNFGSKTQENDFHFTLTKPILIKKIQIRGRTINASGTSGLGIAEYVQTGSGWRVWHEFNFPDGTVIDKEIEVNSTIPTQRLNFSYIGSSTSTVYVQIFGVYIEFELA